MKFEAKVASPPVQGDSYDERWNGPDKGLICSWLRGLEKAIESPELAHKARDGELPVLPWKGGVERTILSGSKIGSLCYLAMWQGLRGEDLDIDAEKDHFRVYSKTGVEVVFTPMIERLFAAN